MDEKKDQEKIQGLDLSDLDKISGGAGSYTKEVLTIDPYGNIVPMSEEKKDILIKTMEFVNSLFQRISARSPRLLQGDPRKGNPSSP